MNEMILFLITLALTICNIVILLLVKQYIIKLSSYIEENKNILNNINNIWKNIKKEIKKYE